MSVKYYTYKKKDTFIVLIEETMLARLFVSAAAYFIWAERNARIHEGKISSPSAITQKVKRLIRGEISVNNIIFEYITTVHKNTLCNCYTTAIQ